MSDFPTSNFNSFTVICLCNRSKQERQKWNIQLLHITTCLLFLDFLLSLPYFHQWNTHNTSEMLQRGVWQSLSCPPNTTMFLSLTFNRSKVGSLTLLHISIISTLFTDPSAGVVRSGLTYDWPRTLIYLFPIASMKLRIFGPYLSGIIHPKATHFWNSLWDPPPSPLCCGYLCGEIPFLLECDSGCHRRLFP